MSTEYSKSSPRRTLPLFGERFRLLNVSSQRGIKKSKILSMRCTLLVSPTDSRSYKNITASLTTSRCSYSQYVRVYHLLFGVCAHEILFTVLHPYFKLDYIAKAWGGEKERLEEVAKGNRNAKNWYAEAEKIVKETVCVKLYSCDRTLTAII